METRSSLRRGVDLGDGAGLLLEDAVRRGAEAPLDAARDDGDAWREVVATHAPSLPYQDLSLLRFVDSELPESSPWAWTFRP